MTHILDQVAKNRRSRFHPASPDEYAALRLAYRLGEPEAAAHYAMLASQYSQAKLLYAFRRAMEVNHGAHPSQVFHDYLSAHGDNSGNGVPHPRLMAVRLERRTIAVAVFTGLHLEGHRVLQLSSELSRAESSAVGFMREVLLEHYCPSVAIESVPSDVQRAGLHSAILQQCRSDGISVWEISKRAVFEALAHPPLKTRGEVRELMLRMWPMAALKKSQVCVLDAFALGLYVQTERLLAADS